MAFPDIAKIVRDKLQPPLIVSESSVTTIQPIDLQIPIPQYQSRLDARAAIAAEDKERLQNFETFLKEERGR